MSAPEAVLLDVGGVLLLPDHDRIRGAFARAGVTPVIDDLDRAHYSGAARMTAAVGGREWREVWAHYLDAYLTACAVPDELRDDVHAHLDSEYASDLLWTRVAPGSVEGLRALQASGVRLGVVSNADGTIEQLLRERGVLQVGPGPGVPVECVVDSSVVGVSKPDPRIFAIALDAMGVDAAAAWYVGDTPSFDVAGARAAGLRPFVMDPFQLHSGADYERVRSLHELAALVRR